MIQLPCKKKDKCRKKREQNEYTKPIRKFPRDWVSRKLWVTPEPLYVLCGYIVDELPLPDAFKWKNMDVLKWIERLGFKQYRNTFYENMINGRTLLLVDASALSAMNIKRFDHIKIITKAIRDLYQVEQILFNRSISLPPRYPDTHFKLYRVCTGPKYELCTRCELWREMKILRPKPPFRTHWIDLTNWLKHIPDYQWERIGYAPRFKLYAVKKKPPGWKPPIPPEYRNKCECMPPCECQWTEDDTRRPWFLQYLADRGQKPYLDPGDIVVCTECVCAESEEEIREPEPVSPPPSVAPDAQLGGKDSKMIRFFGNLSGNEAISVTQIFPDTLDEELHVDDPHVDAAIAIEETNSIHPMEARSHSEDHVIPDSLQILTPHMSGEMQVKYSKETVDLQNEPQPSLQESPYPSHEIQNDNQNAQANSQEVTAPIEQDNVSLGDETISYLPPALAKTSIKSIRISTNSDEIRSNSNQFSQMMDVTEKSSTSKPPEPPPKPTAACLEHTKKKKEIEIKMAQSCKFTEKKCNCFPPCQCRWKKEQMKPPWVLCILKKKKGMKDPPHPCPPPKKPRPPRDQSEPVDPAKEVQIIYQQVSCKCMVANFCACQCTNDPDPTKEKRKD